MSRPDPSSYDAVPDPSPARIGAHPVDAFSLVAGLLAVGYALLSLLDADVEPEVVLPVLLVVAGVAGLVAAVRSSRR